MSHMDGNAFDIFSRQTDNLGLYFDNEMIHRWSNINQSEEEILNSVAEVLEENGSDYSDIPTDAALNEKILSSAAPHIIELLRRNSVTGAFFVLDGIGVAGENTEGNRAAFYVRDNDPSTFTSKNSDLLLERGLPAIAKEQELPLDSFWSALIYEGDENSFFMRPIEEARKSSHPKSKNYGYWSGPFRLSAMDHAAVAYTIPLISADGTVFGALGVDLSLDYLTSRIKMNRYSQGGEVTFALVKDEGDQTPLTVIAQDGELLRQYYATEEEIRISAEKKAQNSEVSILDAVEQGKGGLYCTIHDIKLYNTNTPFEQERWRVIGVQEEHTLLRLTRQLKLLVYVISLITLLVGTIAVSMVVISITRPMKTLMSELERSNPLQQVLLPKLGIQEIDRLSESIEEFSRSVAESASRFSKIIQKTNIQLGVFEYQMDGSLAYCSEKLFDVLCWQNEMGGDRYLELSVFLDRMKELRQYDTMGDVSTYQITEKDGKERWVSITSQADGNTCLGVAVNITSQVAARKKVEYERDFDPLTDLHNRRAFMRELDRLFQNPDQLKNAAMVMWDLDNLKYVNDTYGHDFGDRYIINFAQALQAQLDDNCLLARRSGDEFYMFFYGADNREEIHRRIAAVWKQIEQGCFRLPNGNDYKIRASGGISWYPQDADNASDLIRFADFAMYSVKHSTKGSVEEFSKEDWKRNALLVNGQEAFDRLIDEALIEFAFQPIVEVESGKVYGYEALMRSQLPQFSSPEDILRVARSQSRLLAIEKLTIYGAIKAYARMRAEGKISPDSKVFINSLPNQSLSEQELDQLADQYGGILSNIVLEITESEAMDSSVQSRKHIVIREKWGGQIAVDDYGSGYNGASVLLHVVPDILKVDISIIHHVNQKADNLKILESIISYARHQGIKVLAEGVESREEVEACIAAGVDMLQGYYVGKPAYEITPVSKLALQNIAAIKRSSQKMF